MNILKKISYAILFISLFVIGNSAGTQNTNAQEVCSVESVVFDKITGGGDQDFQNNYTNAKITTKNCQDGIRFNMKYFVGNEIKAMPITDIPSLFFPKNNITYFKFQLTETACRGNNDDIWKIEEGGTSYDWECITFAEVYDSENSLIFSGNSDPLTPKLLFKKRFDSETNKHSFGVLASECLLACNQQGNFKYDRNFDNNELGDKLTCDITASDISFNPVTGYITNKLVVLNINTVGKCENQPINIELYEYDTSSRNNTIDFNNKGGEDDGDVITIITPIGKNEKITFNANDDDCDEFSDTTKKNCTIYVKITKPDGTSISTRKELDKENNVNFETAINYKKGVIVTDCKDRDCGELQANDWKILDSEGKLSGFTENNPQSTPTVKPDFDRTSPCFVSRTEGTGSTGNGFEIGEEGYDRDCYELLAPIPGFGTTDATGRSSVNLKSLNLGDYLNTIFQTALGILMVLAVIMIVVAGVQYMTSEAIFQKEEAKGTITKAVTGLILGLGIFIILNTINPRLLQINFGAGIEVVEVNTADSPDDLYSGGIVYTADVDDVGSPIFKRLCKSGKKEIIRRPNAIQVKEFTVCSDIAQRVRNMLAAAEKDGVIMTAYGARGFEKQKALRAQNCGGNSNILNKNAKCDPLTAIPGTSQHEAGLALDLRCINEGKELTIQAGKKNTDDAIRPSTIKCWDWLEEKNLDSKI